MKTTVETVLWVVVVALALYSLVTLPGCARGYRADGVVRVAGDNGFIPCDTDLDCETKNGGEY
jgi:hypothetical protein